jgi:hypothetical protein
MFASENSHIVQNNFTRGSKKVRRQKKYCTKKLLRDSKNSLYEKNVHTYQKIVREWGAHSFLGGCVVWTKTY